MASQSQVELLAAQYEELEVRGVNLFQLSKDLMADCRADQHRLVSTYPMWALRYDTYHTLLMTTRSTKECITNLNQAVADYLLGEAESVMGFKWNPEA